MAKITKIKFPARVACSHGAGKRAFLNPAARLYSNTSYQLALPENGFVNNSEAAFISALPGGYRNNNGTFNNIGNNGNWWSSSESSATNAWNRNLNYNNANVNRNNNNKENGFFVRCVRDLIGNSQPSEGLKSSEGSIFT